MKAIVLRELGDPENLVLTDVPIPSIEDHEVLVQVKAIAINPVDAFVRHNKEALGWVYQYKGTEPYIILGWDVAGIVTKTGKAVTRFRKGDEVFGNFKFVGQANAYAEYVAAPENEMVLKPANVSFEEAAGATMAALTAWVSIVNYGKIKKGDKIIIHGASGGIGHYAIQIAKHIGAYVIGISSGDKEGFVRGRGADEFIDYTKQKFEEIVSDADIVHDTVWSDDERHIERSLRSLKPGGTLLSLIVYPDKDFIEKAKQDKNVDVFRVNVRHPEENYLRDMQAIAGLLQAGVLKTHISRVFPLKDMAKAHALIQTKNTVGKIIVTP